MSEKQRGGIRKCLPVVLEELKEGIDIGALRDKGDCRHDTLYVIRDILSGAKLIFEEGGKWYYTCKKEKEELLKDYQEFKNKDEYDTKLNHSKNLLKEAGFAKSAIDPFLLTDTFNMDVLSFMDSPNFVYFRQHLETGYPHISVLYKGIEEDDSDMEKAFSILHQRIGVVALESGIEFPKAKMCWLKFSTDADQVVYADFEVFPQLTFEDELNKGSIPKELKDMLEHNVFIGPGDATVRKEKENEWEIADKEKIIIRKEDEKLNIYRIRDLKKEWQKMLSEKVFVSLSAYLDCFFYEQACEEVIENVSGIIDPYTRYGKEGMDEFYEKCLRSEHIKQLHSELAEISKKTAKDYFEFIREIKFIIIKVLEDGEPLRGTCDRCPKITIGRGS
ncbi:hypothetical protein C5S29_05775 [ANME-1 cluster archaeon GoMg3.2]|nr:hypothetical protein [ANME-1 cluster archaeon GoMg3.2]